MKFGVNTFNFVSPFRTAADLSLLDRVKDMGFDLIEIAFEDPATIDVAALANHAGGLGLGVLACGVFGPGRNLVSAEAAERRDTADYIRGLIDAAAAFAPTLGGLTPAIGGPMYGAVGKTPAPDRDARQRERDLAAVELRPLAAYAHDRGVRLALELLNRYETDLLNVVSQGLEMVAAVDSPALGLHLDTYHMHLEERDSAVAIRRAGERLYHFHACENDWGVPGRGRCVGRGGRCPGRHWLRRRGRHRELHAHGRIHRPRRVHLARYRPRPGHNRPGRVGFPARTPVDSLTMSRKSMDGHRPQHPGPRVHRS